MTFKEFDEWCNARACDGMWSIGVAIASADILNKMFKIARWRRREKWKEFEPDAVQMVEFCKQYYCDAKMDGDIVGKQKTD